MKEHQVAQLQSEGSEEPLALASMTFRTGVSGFLKVSVPHDEGSPL